MIAWVNTPEGEGALVAVQVYGITMTRNPLSNIAAAVVLIDKQFHVFRLADIEWLRWPE